MSDGCFYPKSMFNRSLTIATGEATVDMRYKNIDLKCSSWNLYKP